MSSINMPNFINVSVIVFELWPYNQSGMPAGPTAARPPAARPAGNFSKSDNNTLRQILAECKKGFGIFFFGWLLSMN